METWDAITARRDVRRFSDAELGRDQLERILEAGRRAPSSQNWQPWDFVVVTDRQQLQELSQVWRGAGGDARPAPVRRGRALGAVVTVSVSAPRRRDP